MDSKTSLMLIKNHRASNPMLLFYDTVHYTRLVIGSKGWQIL